MVRAGEILELGAFWSIRSEDVPSFDRYYSQLQSFYDDYRSAPLPLILTPACSRFPSHGGVQDGAAGVAARAARARAAARPPAHAEPHR